MPRVPVKPRRKPKTSVGKSIADALVTAAEQILSTNGVETFSTNKIAQRAGVSVGSLYQYFPNKESLLAEVARRLEQRTAQTLIDTLKRCRDQRLRAVAGEVVDVLLGNDIGELRMRHALRREVPAGWTSETSAEVDQRVRQELMTELARRTDVREGPTPMMTWMVAHTVEMIVEHAVNTQPELMTVPVFRDELVELVVRYLQA